MEVGNRCSVSVFFAQVGSQISPRLAKKDSNITSPGRTRSVKCPTPGPTKTNKSPPLRPCWHWCANGCNSSQQCWDLQCIVGRIQPIRLCKPCVMLCVAPTMLGELCKRIQHCCAKLQRSQVVGSKRFDRFQTLRNNSQQHATTYNRVCKRT